MTGFWNKFKSYLIDDFLLKGAALGLQDQENPGYETSFVHLVEQARKEWEQAKILFNEATDPELVDHAIFAMESAERKYVYLLKQAKQGRIIDEDLYQVQIQGSGTA